MSVPRTRIIVQRNAADHAANMWFERIVMGQGRGRCTPWRTWTRSWKLPTTATSGACGSSRSSPGSFREPCPPGIPRGNIDLEGDYAPMYTAAGIDALIQEAQPMIDGERARLGLPPRVVAPLAVVVMPPIDAAGPGFQWRSAELDATRGTVIVFNGNEVGCGRKAVHWDGTKVINVELVEGARLQDFLDAPIVDEARVQPVRSDAVTGERTVPWIQCIESSQEVAILGFERRLPGPKSGPWYLRQFRLNNVKPTEHTIRLCQLTDTPPERPGDGGPLPDHGGDRGLLGI